MCKGIAGKKKKNHISEIAQLGGCIENECCYLLVDYFEYHQNPICL
jgi:hypothetical protein